MRLSICLLACLPACSLVPDSLRHWYLSGSEHEHAAEWGYDGETGPDHWGELDPSYALAKEGRGQSPIDIATAGVEPADLPELVFHYQPERATLLNNGHTLQHNDSSGSWMQVGDTRYALQQFHFHTPSEHTIDGRHAAGEIHFVHSAEDGEVAVVAVLVQGGATTSRIDDFAGRLPTEPGQEADLGGTAALESLLPAERSYFTYSGSFTTPPCTEGVRWIVMCEPIRMTTAAIEAVRCVEGHNNRPTQELHARTVRVQR